MKARRTGPLVLLAAYLLAQNALVAHPYEHDGYPGANGECVICDAIGLAKGFAQVGAGVTATPVGADGPTAIPVRESSRLLPPAYASRAPPAV